MTGSPTRVQSPARRRPLLRSKSAAPKKKDTHVGVFLFWSGRRGATRYRHPTNGRAIRRSPAGPLDLTRCAQVAAASSSLPAAFQKENTILTDGVSFWSGRRGSNSLPRPWQGRALPDELRPQTAPLLRHLGASGRSRTNDTRIFSPLLYQLSYRGKWRPRWGSNPRPPA